MMNLVILQGLFFLLFPALILLGIRKSRKLEMMSPILLSYLAGIILTNLGFVTLDKTLALTIAEFSVPLAIPLVLFSTDFVHWLRLAKSTLLSFCLVIVSGIASSMLAARFFMTRVDEFWQVAGMLTGVYTGGTPNLMAIGLALGVREETFILVNTADVIMGGLYLIFLMLFAQRLLRKFLPAYKKTTCGIGIAEAAAAMEQQVSMKDIVKALVLAVLAVGISVALSLWIYGDVVAPLIIITVTTLGLAASFNKKIRKAPGSYEAGHYLLLVFSLGIGTTVNFSEMVSASPQLFLYTAVVMTGAVILHFALSAVFRIDTDTVIITSTAGIFGPAFIAPIAGALKNREVLVSGMTTALVGYALGNYLGLAVAYLLRP